MGILNQNKQNTEMALSYANTFLHLTMKGNWSTGQAKGFVEKSLLTMRVEK